MDIGWKVASTGAIVAAGFIADKIVDAGWKATTGRVAPRGDEEITAKLTEVVIFSVVSAALVAVIRYYALRGANKWYGGRLKDSLESVTE